MISITEHIYPPKDKSLLARGAAAKPGSLGTTTMTTRLSTSPHLSYEIARVALLGFAGLSCLPLFIVSLIVIRQRKDPARRQFTWLKVALLLFFLAFVLETVADALIALRYAGYYSSMLAQTIDRVSDWGLFCNQIANIFTLFTLFDLGLSIMYCWDVMRSSRFVVQMVTYSFGLVEFALAVASLGIYECYTTSLFSSTSSVGTASLNVGSKVAAAFDILMFIASLIVASFAVFVQVLSSKRLEHGAASKFFILAAIIWIVPNLWAVVSDGIWLLSGRPRIQTWPGILDGILDAWLSVTTLVLVFAIGVRKARGLWSTIQPFDPAQQWGYSGEQQWIGQGTSQPMPMPVYNGQQQMPPHSYSQQHGQTGQVPDLHNGQNHFSKTQNELHGSVGALPHELSVVRGDGEINELSAAPLHHELPGERGDGKLRELGAETKATVTLDLV